MKIINTNVNAVHCGQASVDYMYVAEDEVLLDNDKTVFVHIQIVPSGEIFYAVNTDSLCEERDRELAKPIIMFPSLRQALKSEYASNFRKLNKLIKKAMEETLNQEDDTLYNGGIRFGARISNKGLTIYGEGVTCLEKNDKYIYLQDVQTNGKSHYSITETSVFLRMEMLDMYAIYFGNRPQVPFLIETDDLESLRDYDYLKEYFIDMDNRIDEIIKEIKSKK